ncbi:hypothetical protein [Nonomuraea rubra]|uniref:hypothetical protein n=1 Tax=Nonomuraea rubra TaxID=46180 RepID=UPI0033EDB253
MNAAGHRDRTLARRYWHALIDSRPYELGDVRVRRDLSLWHRYWTALLGLPPAPAPEPSPASERSAPEPPLATERSAREQPLATESPPVAEHPAAHPRERRTRRMPLARMLLPLAATGMAIAFGLVVIRPFTTPGPIAGSPSGSATQVSGDPRTEDPGSTTPALFDEVVTLPFPATAGEPSRWRLTPQGATTAGPGDADLVLTRDAIYVDENRTRVVTSREQCRRTPPTEDGPEGERRVRPHQHLCILTHASHLAYVVLDDPAGGAVKAAITIWPTG